MISVCFRFDDPSATSDHDLERVVLDLLARFEVPVCVATIPFSQAPNGGMVPLSAQNAAHLLEAAKGGAIEIAQHGHSHIRRGVTELGLRSEFAGVPAIEQRRLIREGMEHLSCLFRQRIKGFVPPWNTYDRSTAQAVDEAGFEFLSAGEEVITSGTLPVVPGTCALHNVRRVVEEALCFRSLAPVLVAVFHPDDFVEFRSPPLPDEPPPHMSLRELESLLSWIKSIPYVQLETLSRIATSVRSGTPLQNPADLSLPYRVKALVPPILVRSGDWTTIPGVLWGALRRRRRLDA
jgi:peptidoglycan/xylan/chitin deacetylase (PgdA/CDA1 family)